MSKGILLLLGLGGLVYGGFVVYQRASLIQDMKQQAVDTSFGSLLNESGILDIMASTEHVSRV